MKRRRLFQYAGFGSVGYLLAVGNLAQASTLATAARSPYVGLETFEFEVPTLDNRGRVRQQRPATARFFPESLGGSEKIELVAIAPGNFWMGASGAESQAESHEFPRHRVTLAPFFLSKYPITQSQWAAVATWPKVQRDLDPFPAHFSGGDRPVESVSWLEAMEFCDRLSQRTGRRYSLPSEAQWEYACRAGTQTPFHTGDTITSQMADYVGTYTYRAEAAGDYRQATIPVGHFAPNAFGLHDMHGNVWEWCADRWHANYRGAPTQGQPWVGSSRSAQRAIRGGGWLDAPAKIRAASRSGYLETSLNRTIGFRVSTV